MGRMDKYIDDEQKNSNISNEEMLLSRVNKNQIMYDDVYFNRIKVNLDTIVDNDNKVEVLDTEMKDLPVEEKYEEKSYSVNEFLEKAHENKSPDNAKRDIDDTEFKEQEDEIRKLIASIDEKEESEDFFKDLKGDNEDTLIGAKFKTDEFNDSIYETLKEDLKIDSSAILDHVLGDKTILNLEKEEEDKIDHTFEEIMKSDSNFHKKKNKLPVIIFCITLFILIVVIIIIIVLK